MKTFFITFFLILAAIGSYNIWKDPANRWHALRFPEKENFKTDEVWCSPENYDDGKYMLSHLGLIPNPAFCCTAVHVPCSCDHKCFLAICGFSILGCLEPALAISSLFGSF